MASAILLHFNTSADAKGTNHDVSTHHPNGHAVIGTSRASSKTPSLCHYCQRDDVLADRPEAHRSELFKPRDRPVQPQNCQALRDTHAVDVWPASYWLLRSLSMSPGQEFAFASS